MSFTSVTYFLFVGISLLIYTIVPKRAKWCVLLGASAVYYVMAAGLRTLWLVAAILIVYGGGLLLGHLNDQGKARRKAAADKEEKKQIRKKYDAKKRAVVTVAVLGVFGLLIALKYVNFLGESAYGIAGCLAARAPISRCKFCCPWVFLTIPCVRSAMWWMCTEGSTSRSVTSSNWRCFSAFSPK